MTQFEEAARMILASSRIIGFTGAGASTDSGVPDYRGIGQQYWTKYNMQDLTFQRFLANESSRKEYWRMEQEFYELVLSVAPNDVHYVLADLERRGKLLGVITQNVDGLHQKGGVSKEKVIEIHGTIFTVSCFQCFKKYSRQEIYERIKSGIEVPLCSFCHGLLKSDTISFGQPLIQEVSARSLALTLQSDLFLVVGSSLLVQPAAYLVAKAKEAGARVIIINFGATPYDYCADLLIYDNATQAMAKILYQLEILSQQPQ
ncbi:MAG: Sir2 family NAD-dependent protein deacetylase [Candidatus Omnitrophica bacterium]|nr:Sir2 family NAD-dependent protein deacetylase [Candidatus Omnitrophota bacterium]